MTSAPANRAKGGGTRGSSQPEGQLSVYYLRRTVAPKLCGAGGARPRADTSVVPVLSRREYNDIFSPAIQTLSQGLCCSALFVIAWPVADKSWPAPAVVLQAPNLGAAAINRRRATAIEARRVDIL